MKEELERAARIDSFKAPSKQAEKLKEKVPSKLLAETKAQLDKKRDKYDPKKDNIDDPGSQPFEYLQFESLTQILEQLSHHDKSISKTYWNLIGDSMEIGVYNYSDGWYNDLIKDDHWIVEDMDNYKPELKSPFNTLHEISPINQLTYTKCEKLYFEIHPVNLLEGSETYLVKLLCNNDEIFKEYINYMTFKKKGLKMFLEMMFRDMERFK